MTQCAMPFGQFRFTYVREIGRGGLGRVDEVRIVASNCDKAVGQSYACKRLNEQFDAHPTFRERFEREIAAVRRMSHPGVVAYEGESLPNGRERFYLMPLYAESLRDRLSRAQRRGSHWRDVVAFGILVAEAMAYAHACGMIHRDLKPENILFDAAGRFVVADWGLGYFVHRHSRVLTPLTIGGMGTEYYCCIEQWNTGKCGETGDVYSLGVVLAELVRGYAKPFPIGMGVRDDVVQNDVTWPATAFSALIREMTAMLPQHRPPSMHDVADRLRVILAG